MMMMMLCYHKLSAQSLLQTSHHEVEFEVASHKEVIANDLQAGSDVHQFFVETAYQYFINGWLLDSSTSSGFLEVLVDGEGAKAFSRFVYTLLKGMSSRLVVVCRRRRV